MNGLIVDQERLQWRNRCKHPLFFAKSNIRYRALLTFHRIQYVYKSIYANMAKVTTIVNAPRRLALTVEALEGLTVTVVTLNPSSWQSSTNAIRDQSMSQRTESSLLFRRAC